MSISHTGKRIGVLLLGWLALGAAGARAGAPGAGELDAAIKGGDFTAYYAAVNAWLDRQVPAAPAGIAGAALAEQLKDPAFRLAVDHRQFIAKHGVANLNTFAKEPGNQPFLAWVMKDAALMDLYLEAATPSRDKLREENAYRMDIGALRRWQQLYTEDPDTHRGMHLKMAMAVALAPPGGAGQYRGDEPINWLTRYKHYKAAQQNKALVPSFDHLTVSDYARVLNGIGSDTDLAWGRKMIQTWRPDLLQKEQINKIVSEVWRRSSPIPFTNGFVTVMEGGGKCGPRGLFGAFICAALGIPAIVVGQPAHCCFAARADYPDEDPQIGSAWKVYQGRGWQVSDCGDAMYGPEFVAEMTKRYRTAEFSLVEHLRWLASALPARERADAVRAQAVKLRKPVNTSNPWGVPAAELDIVLADQHAPSPATVPEDPIPAAPGVIHVEAETFTNMLNACVYDCYTGGKQVNFQKSQALSWVEYHIAVPEDGTYALEVMVAAANRDQVLDVSCGGQQLGTVAIPGTTGLWQKMAPVAVKLSKGSQVLRLAAPFQRGVAIRWFELKRKA